MNILIIEDEKYNYDLLCDILHEQMPECTVFGPLTTIVEGQRFFEANRQRIDIIIADIQLSDGLSFHALTDAPADVPIIFITAYDEYALKAFEYNSLSYLLKPVDDEELRIAIRKTQERMITDERRSELFSALSAHCKYRERFTVKTYKGEKILEASQIRYIVSEQKCTHLVLHDGTSYEMDKPLSTVAEELNPEHYMRVNRQYIVPLREVEGLEPGTNGSVRMILKGGEQPDIIISRDKKAEVHKWLE